MYHAFWGLATILVGLGLALPTLANDHERRPWMSHPLFAFGAAIIALGILAAICGIWLRRSRRLPVSMYPSLIVLALTLLGTISATLANVKDHPRAYWLLIPFGVALALFYGLINGRGWGRVLTRWGGVVVSLALVCLFAYAIFREYQKAGPPDGPLGYMLSGLVTLLVLLTIIVGAMFYPLGRPSAKAYSVPFPPDPSRQPWYQFRLKSLLIFMGVLAIPLTAAVMHIRPYRERRAALERLREAGEIVPNAWIGPLDDPQTPWYEQFLYGGKPLDGVQFFVIVKRPTDEQFANVKTLQGPWPRVELHVRYALNDADFQRIARNLKVGYIAFDSPAISSDGWTKLEEINPWYLCILHSDFSDEDLLHLQKMNIRELHLIDTKVTGTGLANLRAFEPNGPPGLGRLTLDKSPVTDDGLRNLHQAGIYELSLAHTNVTGVPLADFVGLERLSTLNLSHTNVNNDGLAFLERAKNLEELKLTGCKISGKGLRHLRPHAESNINLKLNDTPLTDEDLADLENPGWIEMLNLAGTNVTGVGFSKLEKTMIWNLDLRRTKVNAEGLHAIAAHGDALSTLYVDATIVPLAIKIFKEHGRRTTISTRSTEPFFED